MIIGNANPIGRRVEKPVAVSERRAADPRMVAKIVDHDKSGLVSGSGAF